MLFIWDVKETLDQKKELKIGIYWFGKRRHLLFSPIVRFTSVIVFRRVRFKFNMSAPSSHQWLSTAAIISEADSSTNQQEKKSNIESFATPTYSAICLLATAFGGEDSQHLGQEDLRLICLGFSYSARNLY